MADPQPIEYELEDHAAKPPESEAEAIARLQREDEEKARSIGLVKEKHSSKTGKKWMDSIGGSSTNAIASRLLEQEARAAERKRQARVAGVKLVAVLLVGLIVVVGGAAAACDYMGVISLGIFPKPASEAVASQTAAIAPMQSPVAEKPGIRVLGVIGEATPLDNPPSEAPPARDSREPVASLPTASSGEVKRLERQLESAQRGVDTVQGDLAEKRSAIIANLKLLYGIVPVPRDVPPDRRDWRHPCAMLELEQAANSSKTGANAAQANIRLQNAQAQVNNLNAYLKHDRGLEKDMGGRLKRAERELASAREALAAARTAP
jgi:hypothetical protein